LTGADNAGLV